MFSGYNIEKTNTIDGIAYREKTRMLIMELDDGMDWTQQDRHIRLLCDKLNSYLHYVDTKQYREKYPDVERIELRVNLLYKEPEICMNILRRTGEVLVTLFSNSALIVEQGSEES